MTRWIPGFVCAIAMVTAGCGAPPEPARQAEPPAATPTPAPTPAAPPTPDPAPPATPSDKPAPSAEKPADAPADASKPSAAKHGPGVYAHFTTNHGNFIVKFFEKDAPKTVENFVGLAEGKKAWTDPRTGRQIRRPYYRNVVFHRVIPNFMIQGGDPEGTGMGGPGYHIRRRDQPEPQAQQAGHRLHGQSRTEHQRRSVFHHRRAVSVS